MHTIDLPHRIHTCGSWNTFPRVFAVETAMLVVCVRFIQIIGVQMSLISVLAMIYIPLRMGNLYWNRIVRRV